MYVRVYVCVCMFVSIITVIIFRYISMIKDKILLIYIKRKLKSSPL